MLRFKTTRQQMYIYNGPEEIIMFLRNTDQECQLTLI